MPAHKKSKPVQTQILLLDAKGWSKRRIARDLGIARVTVDSVLKEANSDHGISIVDALFAHGITPEFLAQKLKERIDAREVKVFNGKDGIVYSESMEAWDVQADAQDMAHKLRGDYAEQKVSVGGTLFHRLLANVPRPTLPKGNSPELPASNTTELPNRNEQNDITDK